MLRWLSIAVVLASCGKGKDAAPKSADTTGGTPPQQAPAPVTSPTPPPSDPGPDRAGGDGKPAPGDLKEATRTGAMLGPSAPTSAFDPIEGGSDTKGAPTGGGSRRGPAQVGATGGGSGLAQGDAPTKSSFQARIGDISSNGKPAPTALAGAIRVHLSEVQACYDKALVKSPGVQGKLDVTFTVLPTGALSAATVTTTTVKNVELESCVVGVLEKIKLPKPLGTADVPGKVVITFVDITRRIP